MNLDVIQKRAIVIAFLGIDGSGKTTQARRLAAWLDEHGASCHFLTHDSLSPVRNILDAVARESGFADQLEMLGPDATRLYSAVVKLKALLNARAHFEAPDAFLVIDRYAECQYAAARATGAGNEPLLRAMFAGVPRPDLSLFIDVPPAVAQRRIEARGIDSGALHFLESYRDAYLSLPEAPGFTHIKGDQPEEKVAKAVQFAVAQAFRAHRVKERV